MPPIANDAINQFVTIIEIWAWSHDPWRWVGFLKSHKYVGCRERNLWFLYRWVKCATWPDPTGLTQPHWDDSQNNCPTKHFANTHNLSRQMRRYGEMKKKCRNSTPQVSNMLRTWEKYFFDVCATYVILTAPVNMKLFAFSLFKNLTNI